MKYTLTIITENKPGVLYRIADIFLRRKINIESLTVAELPTISNPDQIETNAIGASSTSRFTVVLTSNEDAIDKVVKQLRKIIEVIEVYASTDDQILYNEIALLRVQCKNKNEAKKLAEKILQYKGRVMYNTAQEYVFEINGTEDDIQKIVKDFQQFSIQDIALSGRTAIKKEIS